MIASLIRHTKLLLLFAKLSLQDATSYRWDFLAHIMMALCHVGAELIVMWTIFSNTRSLAGWSAWDVLVLLGVFRIVLTLIMLFIAPNMRQIMEDIREGALDYALLKPVNCQFYVSFRRIAVWRAADIGLGLGLIAYAVVKVPIAITVGSCFSTAVMLFAGFIIIYSFWLVLATSAFWFTRIANIEMVFWNIFEAGKYPVDIYRPAIRQALTYIIPLAFLITFPAEALLRRKDAGHSLFALGVAALAIVAASAFWRLGLRRYSGASA